MMDSDEAQTAGQFESEYEAESDPTRELLEEQFEVNEGGDPIQREEGDESVSDDDIGQMMDHL